MHTTQKLPVALAHDSGDNNTRKRDVMALLLDTPQISGYSFNQSSDLTTLELRQHLSASAIRAFLVIADKWKLNEMQARSLLGGIASSTFHDWKTAPDGKKLSQDVLTRVSLFLGIYKALNTYFGQPLADQWITFQNRGSLFGGLAPVDYMIRQGQPGIIQVRQLLDSWRGGR